MAYQNQKTLRKDIVTKLKAAVTLLADGVDGTVHAFPYWPKNPQAINPFVVVDSDGALYKLPLDDTNPTPMRFVIGVWVRRDDEATAEDQLNDLALYIAQVLDKNYLAKYTDFPHQDYELIEGIPYKFELHFVEISN